MLNDDTESELPVLQSGLIPNKDILCHFFIFVPINAAKSG